NWPWFEIKNLKVGRNTLFLHYAKEMLVSDAFPGGIEFEVNRTDGNDDCTIEFRPAISPRSIVRKVELNGKAIPFQVERHETDQHVVVKFPVKSEKIILRIWLTRDFGINLSAQPPSLGSESRGLRVVSEVWSESGNQLALQVSGVAG